MTTRTHLKIRFDVDREPYPPATMCGHVALDKPVVGLLAHRSRMNRAISTNRWRLASSKEFLKEEEL